MPDHEAIAKRAYELYLKRGSSPGHELADWMEAESELAAAADAATSESDAADTEHRPAAGAARRGRRDNAPAPAGRARLRPAP